MYGARYWVQAMQQIMQRLSELATWLQANLNSICTAAHGSDAGIACHFCSGHSDQTYALETPYMSLLHEDTLRTSMKRDATTRIERQAVE